MQINCLQASLGYPAELSTENDSDRMKDIHLQKTIGPFTATMFGVGAMVGAGIFVLSGIAAGYAGPAVILAFLLNALVALAIGTCYAELGSAMPRAGGSYFWVKTALGKPAGFAVGWIGVYANGIVSALYALGFGSFFVALLQRLGLAISDDYVLVFAVLITVAITYLQYRGIRDLGIVENSVTVIKVLLLCVLVVAGFIIFSNSDNVMEKMTPFAPNGAGGVLMAMAVIFVAFEGFEVITRTGEEMHLPEKNIPLAIYASIIISVSLYLLIAVILIAAVSGPGGQSSWQYLGDLGELGMATTARQLLPYGDVIFYVAGIASTASAMIAATYSAVRVTFALGRAKDLPEVLADIHPQYNSPHKAAIACGVIVLAIVMVLPITEVAGAASQMFALLFAVVCFAAWRLRSTQPDMVRPFRARLLPLCASVGILAGLVVMMTLLNISPLAWWISFAWLLVGGVIFVFRRPAR
ncbi:MAG: APC family permease [Oceanicoccus sp.]